MRSIAPSPLEGEGGPTPQALVVGVRKLSLKQSKIKNRRASLSSFRAKVTSLPAGIGDVRLRRVKLFHSEVCLTASDVRLAAKERRFPVYR